MFCEEPFGASIEIYGESRSEYIGVRIHGVNKGEKVDLIELKEFTARRKSNGGLATERKEPDDFEVLSGLQNGETDGNVIHIRIKNRDVKKSAVDELRFIPRPSTADYPAYVKYGEKYGESGGAFSARLTAPLCVAGGIFKQILKREGIKIYSHIYSVGEIKDTPFNPTADSYPEFSSEKIPVIDEVVRKEIEFLVGKKQVEGDTVGGIIECAVTGIPVGVGGSMTDGLESRISNAVFGIPAVKGVEFGSGFCGAKYTGAQNNDSFTVKNGKIVTETNNAGGILGGMACGMPIVFRAAFKPIPSVRFVQKSVNILTLEETEIKIDGRHDVCAVLRACPAVESAAAVAVYNALKADKIQIITQAAKEQSNKAIGGANVAASNILKGSKKKFCDDLSELRRSIDLCDEEIIKILDLRMRLCEEIGKIKLLTGKKTEDFNREEEILNRLKKEYPTLNKLIESVWREVFGYSKAIQKNG